VIDVPGCVSTDARTVPSEYVATLFAGVAAGISMQPIQRICGSSRAASMRKISMLSRPP
jgi:hypothetical protein